MVESLGYPLVNIQKTMERSTIFHGKTHYKWWFSIAMLVYQRVSSHFHGLSLNIDNIIESTIPTGQIFCFMPMFYAHHPSFHCWISLFFNSIPGTPAANVHSFKSHPFYLGKSTCYIGRTHEININQPLAYGLGCNFQVPKPQWLWVKTLVPFCSQFTLPKSGFVSFPTSTIYVRLWKYGTPGPRSVGQSSFQSLKLFLSGHASHVQTHPYHLIFISPMYIINYPASDWLITHTRCSCTYGYNMV